MKLVTVANCPDLQDAQRVGMMLESHGFSVFLPDEYSAGVAPHHFFNPTGVRVQVPEEEEAAAAEAIEAWRAET